MAKNRLEYKCKDLNQPAAIDSSECELEKVMVLWVLGENYVFQMTDDENKKKRIVLAKNQVTPFAIELPKGKGVWVKTTLPSQGK